MEKRTGTATGTTARLYPAGNPCFPGAGFRAWVLILALLSFSFPEFLFPQQVPPSSPGQFRFGEIIAQPSIESAFLRSVQVSEDIPTVIPRRQRYTVPIGFFPSLLFRFGYWERQDTLCRIFIGRSLIQPMRHDGIQQDDLNWFLAPSDSESCQLMAMAIQGIRGKHPERGFFRFESDIPCLCSPEGADSCITLEAENTPFHSMFALIDKVMFPALLSGRLTAQVHPGIGREHPCVGVYGPLCADYSHHGRPEIHPYHWIWLLSPPPDSGQLRWVAAHLPDKSGRFRKWSPDTLSGHIRFPLYCPELVSIQITEANGTIHSREIGPLGSPPLILDIPVTDGFVQITLEGPGQEGSGYIEIHDRTGAGRIFEIITNVCP